MLTQKRVARRTRSAFAVEDGGRAPTSNRNGTRQGGKSPDDLFVQLRASCRWMVRPSDRAPVPTLRPSRRTRRGIEFQFEDIVMAELARRPCGRGRHGAGRVRRWRLDAIENETSGGIRKRGAFTTWRDLASDLADAARPSRDRALGRFRKRLAAGSLIPRRCRRYRRALQSRGEGRVHFSPVTAIGFGVESSKTGSHFWPECSSVRRARMIVPRGGRVSVSERGCPWLSVSSADTPPRLPTLLPP